MLYGGFIIYGGCFANLRSFLDEKKILAQGLNLVTEWKNRLQTYQEEAALWQEHIVLDCKTSLNGR